MNTQFSRDKTQMAERKLFGLPSYQWNENESYTEILLTPVKMTVIKKRIMELGKGWLSEDLSSSPQHPGESCKAESAWCLQPPCALWSSLGSLPPLALPLFPLLFASSISSNRTENSQFQPPKFVFRFLSAFIHFLK